MNEWFWWAHDGDAMTTGDWVAVGLLFVNVALAVVAACVAVAVVARVLG